MAAATATALEIRLYGSSLAASVKNPSSLDLLQVVDEGGKVVWNLTSAGVATANPSTSTVSALLARYFGVSFSAAFKNPDDLDILQVVEVGGTPVFWVDYTGAAHT